MTEKLLTGTLNKNKTKTKTKTNTQLFLKHVRMLESFALHFTNHMSIRLNISISQSTWVKADDSNTLERDKSVTQKSPCCKVTHTFGVKRNLCFQVGPYITLFTVDKNRMKLINAII